jgi:hypothetical protein
LHLPALRGAALSTPQSAESHDTCHHYDDAEDLVSAKPFTEEEERSDRSDGGILRRENSSDGELLTRTEGVAHQADHFGDPACEDERKGSPADSQLPPDQQR